MHGGPSHVDLFDPKPDLTRLAGQPIPASFGMVMTRRKVAANPLLAPIKPFRPRGQSGIEVSDFLPELLNMQMSFASFAVCMATVSIIRSRSDQMNTGSILMGHPSVGSWVSYGLGSENADLPAYVVLPDPGGGLKGGPPAWGSGYLPASYQGIPMRDGAEPILHLKSVGNFTRDQQRSTLDFVQQLNAEHLKSPQWR